LWFRQNKDEHYYNKVAWGKVFLKKSWRSEVERQRIESKARIRIGTLRKNRDYIVYLDGAAFCLEHRGAQRKPIDPLRKRGYL
jgi:hypothetical protein